MDYSTAAQTLRNLGLTLNYKVSNEEYTREYWWRGDGNDVLIGYSATITRIGNKYSISNFLPDL